MLYTAFYSFINAFFGMYGYAISLVQENLLFMPLAFIISFGFFFAFIVMAMAFSIISFGIPIFILYKAYKMLVKSLYFLSDEIEMLSDSLKSKMRNF